MEDGDRDKPVGSGKKVYRSAKTNKHSKSSKRRRSRSKSRKKGSSKSKRHKKHSRYPRDESRNKPRSRTPSGSSHQLREFTATGIQATSELQSKTTQAERCIEIFMSLFSAHADALRMVLRKLDNEEQVIIAHMTNVQMRDVLEDLFKVLGLDKTKTRDRGVKVIAYSVPRHQRKDLPKFLEQWAEGVLSALSPRPSLRRTSEHVAISASNSIPLHVTRDSDDVTHQTAPGPMLPAQPSSNDNVLGPMLPAQQSNDRTVTGPMLPAQQSSDRAVTGPMLPAQQSNDRTVTGPMLPAQQSSDRAVTGPMLPAQQSSDRTVAGPMLPAQYSSDRTVTGPMLQSTSVSTIQDLSFTARHNESEEVSDEDAGPVLAGQVGYRRATQRAILASQIAARDALNEKGLPTSGTAKDAREIWMTELPENRANVLPSLDAGNRSFRSKAVLHDTTARSEWTRKPGDAVVQPKSNQKRPLVGTANVLRRESEGEKTLRKFEATYRGKSMLEEHLESQKKLDEKTSGKRKEWSWDRERDLLQGDVDMNYTNKILADKTGLKDRFSKSSTLH